MTVTTTWTSPVEGGTLDRDSGQTIREQDWDGVLSNLNHIGGASGMTAVAFTPTLSQGAGITLSAATGNYFRLGFWVFYTVRVVASSAGTAANAVILASLPVTAANTGAFAAPGNGHFGRGTNPVYPLAGVWASSSSMRFYTTAGTGYFGANPAVTIASGDEINISGFYYGA